jgi:hypothetical protein
MMRVSAKPARAGLIVCFTILVLLASPETVHGQSSACASLTTAEAKTYGFEPFRLSSSERSKKSDQMDHFWEMAKNSGPAAVPCLQQMLSSEQNDPFFMFDGSSLLFTLDSSPESLAAISKALLHTDLKDVDAPAYIGFLLQLSHRDVDIGALAEKYMTYPSVETYLPQHAMKLGRVDGALILYGSMKPEIAERYLEGLAKGDDQNARAAAVFCLALNLTEASFRAFHAGISLNGVTSEDQKMIRSILSYKTPQALPRPPLSREQVLKRTNAVIRGDFEHVDESNPPYVAGDEAFKNSAPVQLTPADLPLILEARRRSVRGVSDETIDEYMFWSYIILEIINRSDLYKELRVH